MINVHHLRVNKTNNLEQFYVDLLGMKLINSVDHMQFGYGGKQAVLEFSNRALLAFSATAKDFYWKIGITVGNLDHAVDFLRQQGVAVTPQKQFRDIGYMSKIIDPNGFIIELLQQGFKGNHDSVPDGHPIGSQATFAHITLRVINLATAKSFFEDTLGMRLMSVQPVEDLNFCLYFYAWSDEALPDSDLAAVANREWLWARPYTMIELQHCMGFEHLVKHAKPEQSGFDGFSYSLVDEPEQILRRVQLSDMDSLS